MRLRGHHLICLHFFKGEGYSPDFVANLSQLLNKAQEGKGIETGEAADDVCAKCPHLQSGICCYQDGFEETVKQMDTKAFELLKINKGTRVKWVNIREILPQIFKDWADLYCANCDWRPACQDSPLWQELIS